MNHRRPGPSFDPIGGLKDLKKTVRDNTPIAPQSMYKKTDPRVPSPQKSHGKAPSTSQKKLSEERAYLDKMNKAQNTVGYINHTSLKSVPNAGKDKIKQMN